MPSSKRAPQREAPANLHAERTLLGAVLLDPDLFPVPLEAEDFFISSHRVLFARMVEMRSEGKQIDYVTLLDELDTNKELEGLGESPRAWVAGLTEGLPMRPAVKDYTRIVKAKSLQRQLIVCCEAAIAKAYAGESGFQIVEVLRTRLDEITSDAKRGVRKEEPPT